jgi:hypothetical protein
MAQVVQPFGSFQNFMEPEGSLPRSQELSDYYKGNRLWNVVTFSLNHIGAISAKTLSVVLLGFTRNTETL